MVRLTRVLVTLALGTALSAGPALALAVKYLYRLSNFSGVVPYSDVQICADRYHDEVYVGEGDEVRVFNAAGMEIYAFAHDAMTAGSVADIAVDKGGDILVLSYRQATADRPGGAQVTRSDYRGEAKNTFEISGLPENLAGFNPNRMLLHGDEIAFASTSRCQIVFTDASGAYRRHVDLLDALPKDDKARDGAELGGFFIDPADAILYTIPTAFRAFRRNPDGTTVSFGKSGSAPGAFGVVGAIVEDDDGDVFVADRARGVVLAFDRNFKFISEFGRRGASEEQLTRPGAIVLGNDGKLYVTQLGFHGLSVFSVTSP
jgi:hypothetical protein